MKQTMQKLFKNETFAALLLIVLTTLLTYGTSIPKLGYYYDDWYLLWSGAARGAASIIPLFSIDRPFMGVVYSGVYRLLGDAIVNWQWYALLWRLIGGLAFFWILRLLWPNNKYLTTLMAVLFIVYPGFLSQPDANTKQNHLYGFGTALLSMALMLQAIKVRASAWKVVCMLLSVVLAANYLLIYEYMIGLEGMRLALLGYCLYQEGFRQRRALAWEMFKRWWPYALVTAAFLYWRVFIFVGGRNATSVDKLAGGYASNLRHMSIQLVLGTAKDFLDTSVFAWFVRPYQLIAGAEYANLAAAALVAIVVVGLAAAYLLLFGGWWGGAAAEEESPRPFKEFVWMGAFTVLCAVAPVIASGRQVELNDPYKSYGLHPIGGVVLLLAGLVLMLQPRFRRLVLIALVGISVTTQVLNADYWGRFWNYERQAWWQLSWRAPDIKDNTLVMAYMPDGYQLQQDYETWGPVNLIYRPGPAQTPAIQGEVLNQATAYNILGGDVTLKQMRDVSMQRDFRNLLLISTPSSSSCVHVIDGSLPVYSADDSLQVQQVGSYSRIDRIVPSGNSPVPAARIFGPEPAHGWCYYYQKAALARQAGDWKEIGKLYDQTRALKLSPADDSEVMPFFEGLVNLGRISDAQALYSERINGRQEVRMPLCTALANDPGYPASFGYDYERIYRLLCNS